MSNTPPLTELPDKVLEEILRRTDLRSVVCLRAASRRAREVIDRSGRLTDSFAAYDRPWTSRAPTERQTTTAGFFSQRQKIEAPVRPLFAPKPSAVAAARRPDGPQSTRQLWLRRQEIAREAFVLHRTFFRTSHEHVRAYLRDGDAVGVLNWAESAPRGPVLWELIGRDKAARLMADLFHFALCCGFAMTGQATDLEMCPGLYPELLDLAFRLLRRLVEIDALGAVREPERRQIRHLAEATSSFLINMCAVYLLTCEDLECRLAIMEDAGRARLAHSLRGLSPHQGSNLLEALERARKLSIATPLAAALIEDGLGAKAAGS